MELDGPKSKLGWALKKLEALDRECEAIAEAELFRVVPEFDDETGSHIMRFRVQADAFPRHLGLIVGDLVHNARSALDHAAWLLACRSNPVDELWKPSIAWKIAFPVTRDSGRFKTHRALPFFAEDARTVLESLQPYQGGDTPEAIGRLDELWNIDKHRVVHGSLAHLDMSGVKFRRAGLFARDLIGDLPETIWHPLPESMEDGAPVATLRFRDGLGPPQVKVKVEGEPSAEIAFGSGSFTITPGGLAGLLEHTARALAAIDALPEAPP